MDVGEVHSMFPSLAGLDRDAAMMVSSDSAEPLFGGRVGEEANKTDGKPSNDGTPSTGHQCKPGPLAFCSCPQCKSYQAAIAKMVGQTVDEPSDGEGESIGVPPAGKGDKKQPH